MRFCSGSGQQALINITKTPVAVVAVRGDVKLRQCRISFQGAKETNTACRYEFLSCMRVSRDIWRKLLLKKECKAWRTWWDIE
jgi:hypothetical protein